MDKEENTAQSTIPTNKEIIDELTKDFASTDINKNEDPKIEDLEENTFEDEEKETEPVKKDPFNDFIDEEKLKEAELTLDEDVKQQRKTESDELKTKGNMAFKNENYMESIEIYTNALKICPLQFKTERSVLYSNRAVSKMKLDYNECALDDCTKALELNPDYIKALHRRAKLYEDLDKLDESLTDYKHLLTLEESNNDVRHKIYVLNEKVTKRNEEMKTEMLGKLKDLGNLVLKPFGLSTENFQLNQDPNSGGYSINFVQK